jgi:hypothetical protein
MGQIKNTSKYPNDTDITGNESVIGSDNDNNGKTMNYKLSDLAAYFTEYFNSQNQSVSLSGNITGGNGVVVISTTAQPSLINDKPVATEMSEGGQFLYLDVDGTLKKLDAEIIISSGGYVPPTYTPITLVGSGLEFVDTLSTNNLGHIIAASVRAIQDSTITQKGVIRIANPSEYGGGSTTLALPPAALTGIISGTLNFLPKFTGTNTIGNSVVRESGGNIGIGITPTSDKLAVAGVVLADGFKSPLNSEFSVHTTDGGSVEMGTNLIIDSGVMSVKAFNLNTDVGVTIPTNKSQLSYVTFTGSSPATIFVPASPVVGMRIDVYNSGTADLTVNINGAIIELVVGDGLRLYFNGIKWVAFTVEKISFY